MPSGGAAEASRSQQQKQSMRESGEDSEDESEILEESPCGRWLKRREEVEQRDVPGIDWAFLAMDTEEGVEVCQFFPSRRELIFNDLYKFILFFRWFGTRCSFLNAKISSSRRIKFN